MEILKESYEEAKRLLSAHRNTLDQIAEFLIKRETITGKEFMDIFHRVEGIDPEAEKERESSRISERKTDSVIILPDLQAQSKADEPERTDDETDGTDHDPTTAEA